MPESSPLHSYSRAFRVEEMTEEAHVQSAAVPLGLLLGGTNTEAQALPTFQAQNLQVMDYCWAPAWEAPLSSSEKQDANLLYTLVSELRLTQTLLLREHSVWQTEDQPEEPASQLTWWGGSRKRREVEVRKGGAWPDLLERTAAF